MAAHALSSAARHVNKVVLTVELGPWEGTQFSAPAVKDGDSLHFVCGILSSDGHAISFLRTVEKYCQIIDWVFPEVVYYICFYRLDLVYVQGCTILMTA